ncbi:ABC transporter substrate-binding protein [Oculatella sp. LEGE 06141]|uniref:ABC transporter substrate-binding protein n=1 Tax=Oculatella sp. LEGE 06141 TaxID=1828648 RepID=UPI00187EA625|nr:ABC transporter substrate-binding protein [Oculatella sp. LEGE 06141]MBE9176982.1 ABC transporter substrate-binding protein [Oculatella sp. LEGE 06141]
MANIVRLSRISKRLELHWRNLAIAPLILCLIGLLGCQPTPSSNAGAIHLTLWHGINPPPNRDVFQELVDRFNQSHPTIQVESLYVGQGDQQMPKILAAVVGNAPPNMLWFAPMITGQLVELEAIRPIDDWFDASPAKEQLDPALISSMELEGHLWSIPFSTNNVGIFYRPSLFEAAGITEPPQTWEDLRQVAHTLTRSVNGSQQHGILLPLGKGEWTVFTWLPFMWSGGGDLAVDSVDQVNLVNEGAIAALQLWQDLLNDGSAMLSPPERGYEIDDFLTGRVAMQLTGPWTLGQLQATGVDYDVMPIPVGSEPATSIGGENLFIFNATPEAERAAFTFAEYVMSEAFQTQWALGTGYLPVNVRSRQSVAYKDFVAQEPTLNTFIEQAKYGHSRPIVPGYSRISENLGRAIEATLLGSNPTEALQAAQQRLNLVFGSDPA